YNKDDNDGRGKYASISAQKPRDPGPETTYDYVDNNGKVWNCPAKGWRMTYDKMKALENDNRLILTGNTLRVKDYWNERESAGKRIDTLWNDLPENTKGSSELEMVLGKKNQFDNPKPTELIRRCLEISHKNAIVLDCFAGSGTTAQAVMQLNSDDGGNRHFILCTNNENDICENVTYKRIKNVCDGYIAEKNISKTIKEKKLTLENLKVFDKIIHEFEVLKQKKDTQYNNLKIESKDGYIRLIGTLNKKEKVAPLPINLKYLRTDFIPKIVTDDLSIKNKLIENIIPLIELEHGLEVDGINNIIVTDEEKVKGILQKAKNNINIFITSDIMLSQEEKTLATQKSIKIIEIPEYYFRSELREVGEI
ncbi:DNA methyltransferase, partial [Clostridium perfringens]|uniref:DNA methyltransferase n=2 Tax=Clostridium perfringens TaxID=1502 RepID=UPI003754785E